MQPLHAERLRQLVTELIDDPSTSTAIRNACHQLLIAIDHNNRELIEETLAGLDALRPTPPSPTRLLA